jgi:hypothetical protein
MIMETDCERWYAVHTYARSEKAIEYRCRAKGLTTFLPLATEVHRWSDRRKVIEVPRIRYRSSLARIRPQR